MLCQIICKDEIGLCAESKVGAVGHCIVIVY